MAISTSVFIIELWINDLGFMQAQLNLAKLAAPMLIVFGVISFISPSCMIDPTHDIGDKTGDELRQMYGWSPFLAIVGSAIAGGAISWFFLR